MIHRKEDLYLDPFQLHGVIIYRISLLFASQYSAPVRKDEEEDA